MGTFLLLTHNLWLLAVLANFVLGLNLLLGLLIILGRSHLCNAGFGQASLGSGDLGNWAGK